MALFHALDQLLPGSIPGENDYLFLQGNGLQHFFFLSKWGYSKWCIPNGVFQMVYSKWCIPNGVFQMVYSKWCILNGVFSVPSPCHFTFWGISLSSTEIPGVFNPGYSQRGIFCGVFLQKFAQCDNSRWFPITRNHCTRYFDRPLPNHVLPLAHWPTSELSPTCVTAAWCGPIAIMLASE